MQGTSIVKQSEITNERHFRDRSFRFLRSLLVLWEYSTNNQKVMHLRRCFWTPHLAVKWTQLIETPWFNQEENSRGLKSMGRRVLSQTHGMVFQLALIRKIGIVWSVSILVLMLCFWIVGMGGSAIHVDVIYCDPLKFATCVDKTSQRCCS